MKSTDLISTCTEASAMLLLSMLQHQSNCGWSWETAQCMEPSLAALAPVRRTVQSVLAGDVHTLDVLYIFCISKAQELLRTIQYVEFIQDLLNKPYSEVQGTFIQKCAEYAQSERYYQR